MGRGSSHFELIVFLFLFCFFLFFVLLQMRFSFIGKAQFRRATLSCDNSYKLTGSSAKEVLLMAICWVGFLLTSAVLPYAL